MKVAISLAAALLFAAQVTAQTTPAKSGFKDAPPPSLNDPGVKATPEAANAKKPPAGSTPAEVAPTKLAGKPIPLPRGPGDNSPPRDAPDVQIVQKDDGSTVQEYRRNGQLYMVTETPKNGIPHTYMVGDSGPAVNNQGQPPVHPVMYKVAEFGKAKPAEDQEAPANPAAAEDQK